jgi:hypothetical protein
MITDRRDGTMRYLSTRATIAAFAVVLAACTTIDSDATRLVSPTNSALTVTPPWGPETPNFNLEVILRGDPNGFGLVKFRQPNDADRIVNLDVWVRDLLPNTHYQLQRATDTNVNDDCTGTNWLTLGKGSVPEDIVTDARGTGRAELFRNLGTTAVGSQFDIHFRVINAAGAPVLNSDCYQFTVSQ